MNLTGRPALPKPKKIKPDPKYLKMVRNLPCASCGRPAPSEAHHCRDLPDYDERGLYQRLPGTGERSSDRDAIPLCGDCHRMFHLRRSEFHERNGKDYGLIGPTRAIIDSAEIEF